MNKSMLLEQSESNADRRVFGPDAKTVYLMNLADQGISGVTGALKMLGKATAIADAKQRELNKAKQRHDKFNTPKRYNKTAENVAKAAGKSTQELYESAEKGK